MECVSYGGVSLPHRQLCNLFRPGPDFGPEAQTPLRILQCIFLHGCQGRLILALNSCRDRSASRMLLRESIPSTWWSDTTGNWFKS